MEELGFNEPVSLNQPLKFQEHVHAKFMKYLKEHPQPIRELATKMKMRAEAINNFIRNERLHSRTIDRIASWLMEQGLE